MEPSLNGITVPATDSRERERKRRPRKLYVQRFRDTPGRVFGGGIFFSSVSLRTGGGWDRKNVGGVVEEVAEMEESRLILLSEGDSGLPLAQSNRRGPLITGCVLGFWRSRGGKKMRKRETEGEEGGAGIPQAEIHSVSRIPLRANTRIEGSSLCNLTVGLN